MGLTILALFETEYSPCGSVCIMMNLNSIEFRIESRKCEIWVTVHIVYIPMFSVRHLLTKIWGSYLLLSHISVAICVCHIVDV